MSKKEYSPFGYTHPDRPEEEMCQFCKNEDTQRVIDKGTLDKFAKHIGHKDFKVFECHCCNAIFHFETSEQPVARK